VTIALVEAYQNGTWHTMPHGSGDTYTGSLTAPGTTSYNLTDHVYPLQIRVTNTAGTVVTLTTADATYGNALKLRVNEIVAPTINITSPGAGAYVINSQQAVIFQLRDESGGSGIDLSTLSLKVDGGTSIAYNGSGMSSSTVTNGYDFTYTPPSALADGSHTITINVSDYDGNAATQASRTYTIDTVPPTLNVTNPANSFITNTASLTVQGSTNDSTSSPATVTIKLNTVDQGAITVDGSGNFTKALTLASGSNTIVVRSTDAATKYTEITLTGTLDTSVPLISAVSITPNPADTGATLTVSVTVTG